MSRSRPPRHGVSTRPESRPESRPDSRPESSPESDAGVSGDPATEAPDETARLLVFNDFNRNTVITVTAERLRSGRWEPRCAPQVFEDIEWMSHADWRARGESPRGAVGSVELAITGLGTPSSSLDFRSAGRQGSVSFDGHPATPGGEWRGLWNGQKATLAVVTPAPQQIVALMLGDFQPEALRRALEEKALSLPLGFFAWAL